MGRGPTWLLGRLGRKTGTDLGSLREGQRTRRTLIGYSNGARTSFRFTLIHANWLNQIEIYFSAVHREVHTPNEFQPSAEVEERLMDLQAHYEAVAQPLLWEFGIHARGSPLAVAKDR